MHYYQLNLAKAAQVGCLVLVSLLIIEFFPSVVRPYCYGDTSVVLLSDLDRWAQDFLVQVAGFNLTGHNVTVDNMPTIRGGVEMNSEQYYLTDIEIKVQDGNQTLDFILEFIDSSTGSKFDWYIFENRYSFVSSQKKSFNDCLLSAKQAIEAYRDLFNITYCDDLPGMISTAIQNKRLTVEDQNALLNVSYGYGGEVNVDWYKKIVGQYTIQTQSIGMTVSSGGLLTGLIDNLAVYHVATTSINVSDQEALNTSMPIIKAYAELHGQQISSAKAVLSWMVDSDCSHGSDVYAVYPVWSVWATFDKTNEDVNAYSVIIWADNGQIAYNGPQGFSVATPKADDNPFPSQFILVVLGIAVGLTCLAIYLKQKKTRRRGNSNVVSSEPDHRTRYTSASAPVLSPFLLCETLK